MPISYSHSQTSVTHYKALNTKFYSIDKHEHMYKKSASRLSPHSTENKIIIKNAKLSYKRKALLHCPIAYPYHSSLWIPAFFLFTPHAQ